MKRKKEEEGLFLCQLSDKSNLEKNNMFRWRFESWFPKYSLGNISMVSNTPVWRLAHKVKNTQGCSYLQFMLRETD